MKKIIILLLVLFSLSVQASSFQWGNIWFNTSQDDNNVHTLKTALTDGSGNPIGSLNGAIDVHDADVHDEVVNEYFHRHTGVSDTIAVASAKQDTNITVVNGALFAVGNEIQLSNGSESTTFPKITAIATHVLILDRPLDFAYEVNATVEIVSTNMAVLGSLTNPISFKAEPSSDELWHVIRFLFSMTHATAGDLGLFGNAAALTNGVVLRLYKAEFDQYRTFTLWKTNSDIKDNMYNVDFDTRSTGGGTYGTTGRGSIKIGTGAVPKVDGSKSDFIEMLIQDDLTGLISFKQKIQGHIEGQ